MRRTFLVGPAMMATLAGALSLGAFGACNRGAPEPAVTPESRPCDKTVDNCPRTPISGQPNGTPTTTPPTGDPSTRSPANPPSPPPGQGVPPR